MKEDKFIFQKNVSELLIDLSLFVNKIDPNPFVAIATIQILENKILNQHILHIEESVKITSEKVKELYDHLWTFLTELNLFDYPEVIISALEITKFEYIREVERLSKIR